MRERRWVPLVAAAVLLAGCNASPVPAPTSTSASPSAAFRIVTTERPSTYDPATATTDADAIVALNVFSRLMVVHPDDPTPKPDLATDCLYASPTTYRCELPEGLVFHNGHPLTASDVKFSIERAYRLSVPHSSIRLFDSLDRVDVVDDRTVEFVLKWADTQFGYALATPAAGIVDEEIYDPDASRPNEGQAVGSGPFRLVTTADDRLVFELFADYTGGLTGGIDAIELRFVADSAAAEAAMADGSASAVWRSLTAAARQRIAAEARRTPPPTVTYAPVELIDSRVQRLVFNASSPWREDATIRQAVAVALQPDRSLGSLVPPAVTGSSSAFPVGGSPEVPQIPGQRLRLTLSYDSAVPDQRDLASLVRDRLESKAGMSVQLTPDSPDADLVLTERSAWVNTAFGWLQPYVDDPLPASAERVQQLIEAARSTPDAAQRVALLEQVQAQAAADLTVLPISLGSQTLYLRDGVTLIGYPFGPGWQLGLWSFRV